jgi:hypothetical protein
VRKLVLSTLVLTLAAFGKQSALAADLDSLKLRVGHGAVEEAPSSAPSGPTHPFFRHRLMLQGGAASNKIVSSAAVGTVSGTAGTRFLFEDDLGFASSKMTLDALLRFRLSGRWMIEGEYFGISRDNAAIISRNIQFGPSSFPASAAVNADLNMATYRLALGYAFAKTENFELGGALSLYLLDFSALLRGNATFGGFVASFQTEKFGVPAPLPTIGVYGHYALTSRWLISARVDYTDFSGSVRIGCSGL